MRSRAWILVAALACAAVIADAAPIRVGFLKGTGPGRYWNTSTHTAASVIASILTRQDTVNLGPNPIVPVDGFSITQFGVDSGGGQTPTAAQINAFIGALDTLDVVWVVNYCGIGYSITDTNQRRRLETFIRTKGFVSTLQNTDSYGVWAAWDSIHGARLQNWVNSDRDATLHLETDYGADRNLAYLNRGLPDTARFVERRISFSTNGDVIRAHDGLRVTLTVDEASYAGGLGGSRAMGPDHPISWYRKFPEGGRFFYTGLGHRADVYIGAARLDSLGDTTRPANPFLRRQLYNAILWAAGVDSSGTVVAVRGTKSPGQFYDVARMSIAGSSFAVSVLKDGTHTVEIRGLDGSLIASRRGAGRMEHRFDRLSSHSMLVVTVKTDAGRATKLFAVP